MLNIGLLEGSSYYIRGHKFVIISHRYPRIAHYIRKNKWKYYIKLYKYQLNIN